MLSQFGVAREAAQNIVVVQSELGSAPAIARALDRLEHPQDRGHDRRRRHLLAIARSNRDAVALARELDELVG